MPVQELSEGPGNFSCLGVSLLFPLGSLQREVPSQAVIHEEGGGVLFYTCWGWKGVGAIPVSCLIPVSWPPRRTLPLF